MDGTGIFAPSVDACSVGRTIGVRATFDRCTRHVRVALKSDGAGADGFVPDSGTFGVSAAGQAVGAADGCAVTAAAGMALFAFAVRLTSNLEKIEQNF